MINEPKSTSKLAETLQDIEIILGDPSKVIKVGSTLLTSEKIKTTTILREN